MADDVFISYARATEAEAIRIAAALDDLGYEVWRDDQLAAHEEFSDVIQQRLEAARAVVVLWSREAVKSQWVRSEANRARAESKLVQVNVDGVALPMPFDQIHCANLRGWRGEPDAPGWLQTLKSVAKLANPDKAAHTPRKIAARSTFSAVSDKPSLAVLPFANLSGDPEQDYFIDGLMEEIVTALTPIRTLFVIAASSSLALKGLAITPVEAAEKLGVRYVLEGSVRKAGDRVRVSAKIIDAHRGAQIWADRFDDWLGDIFALQDSVAASVAGVAEFSVQGAEAQISLARPTTDLRSYDLYLRALVEFRTYQRESMYRALEMLDRAIEMDPQYALALSLAAGAHAIIMQFHWSEDLAGHGMKAFELLKRSLQTGSDNPQVLANAAMAFWATGDTNTAMPLADRAVALNPGSSWALLAAAQVRSAMGDLDKAEDYVVRSMHLDPLSPNRNLQLGILAAVRFAQRRFEEVVEICREWITLANHPTSVGMLASTQGHLGEAGGAGQALALLAELSPMTWSEIAALLYRQPEHRALFLEGMGMAEKLQGVAAPAGAK
ncbi:MAG TPA: TIR domain-containing protein [Caulobacteraceae bacterium]|jgi:adenylate cyclase